MVQEQVYSTVPLNDHATSRDNLNPINTSGTDGNFGPPGGSGRNTPSGSGNSKKKWSFLPSMQQNNSYDSAAMNEKTQSGRSTPKRPKPLHRPGSWDLLGDRAEWEEYNPAKSSVENLRFAEGDVGTNKVRRMLPELVHRAGRLTPSRLLDCTIGHSTEVSFLDGRYTSSPSPLYFGFPESSVSLLFQMPISGALLL